MDREVIVTVSGKVLNAKTSTPVEGATVLIERLPDGLDIGHASTDETGKFLFTVKGDALYGLVGEAEGFISQSENLDFTGFTKSDTLEKNIDIFPIEKGETLVLKNIFFDFDKTELKTASYPELNRVLTLMKEDKIEKILIMGHTDSVGPEEYNMALSGRRAKSVMNFFIRSGIARERLAYKAFGETQPKVPNDTEENRSQNRRVEFQIQ